MKKTSKELKKADYRHHYACLACKKSFKRKVDFTHVGSNELVKQCQACRGSAYNLGRHFKPPKNTDTKQWAKVAFLLKHGFWFQKIHDPQGKPVSYPQTMAEARVFAATHRNQVTEFFRKLFKNES